MLLVEYVRQRGIGSRLVGQARNWLRHSTESFSDQREKLDRELMQILPVRLMTEMRVEAWSPVLAHNALFSMIRSKHPRVEYKLCYHALSEVHLWDQDVLFTTGDACSRVFFTVTGRCTYIRGKDQEARSQLQRDRAKRRPSCASVDEIWVKEGTCLCEAAL